MKTSEYEVLSSFVGDDGEPHYVGEVVNLPDDQAGYRVKRGWLKPLPPPAGPEPAPEPEPEPGSSELDLGSDAETTPEGEQATEPEAAVPSGRGRPRNR
jgi:hypothetical protein